MGRTGWMDRGGLSGAAVVLVFSAAAALAQAPPVARKVLFVGDSFTYSQNGIYSHFEKLAAAANPPVAVTTGKSVFGGAFLHRLWDLKDPLNAIQTGSYDVVVLQEDIPETTVADFREYADRFVAEVRKNHARPILFMAWAYPRLGWISMAEIAQAHRDAANALHVDVAPVGLAWQQASKERPGMNFYAPDREHPNIYGTYVATCVIFATIYDRDPTGLAYAPTGVTAEEAAFLQRVAWKTVRDYRAGRI
jgi:lysophospholipase L1-like esterase